MEFAVLKIKIMYKNNKYDKELFPINYVSFTLILLFSD